MLDDLAVDHPNEDADRHLIQKRTRECRPKQYDNRSRARDQAAGIAWPLMAATVGRGSAKRGPGHGGPHHALNGVYPAGAGGPCPRSQILAARRA